MRISPRTKYEKMVVIHLNGEVYAEQSKSLSLFAIETENKTKSPLLKEGKEVKITLDLLTEVTLNGKIERISNGSMLIKFTEDFVKIANSIGKYFRKQVEINGRCPYCNTEINYGVERCPNCKMFLNFDNPKLVETLSKIDIKKIIENLYLNKNDEDFCHKEENYEIIGTSTKMREVFKLIRKYAPTDYPVLIIGESGTGKELVSRAIYERSLRKDKPFVVVNCAAIPENLLESELFGYEKGAFTGADKRKLGRVELANGGTLFLDEIGDMPLPLQAKMLRFLENYTFERVGGTQTLTADVRIIAATNVNLEKAVKEGKFREDLYYRLNVLTIHIPPLREREDDIEVITKYFITKYSKEIRKNIKGITKEAMDILKNYSWPGNVRELLNVIRKAVVMADGEYIDIKDLDRKIFQTVNIENASLNHFSLNLNHTLPALDTAKIQLLKKAYEETNGNISKMAKILGVSRPTVYKLIEKYKIR